MGTKKTKKATFEWLYEKIYVDLDGNDLIFIDNLKLVATDKKNIELRFAFDNDKECNVIHKPTKKEVKKAIHLFGTSVITKL